MNSPVGRRAILASLAALLPAASATGEQQSGIPSVRDRASDESDDVRLPNGKSQKDEILKAEHEQNLKDAAQLIDLAEQLKEDLEKNDRYVLSLATLKKTDDIEKLVKKIRGRLRRN